MTKKRSASTEWLSKKDLKKNEKKKRKKKQKKDIDDDEKDGEQIYWEYTRNKLVETKHTSFHFNIVFRDFRRIDPFKDDSLVIQLENEISSLT